MLWLALCWKLAINFKAIIFILLNPSWGLSYCGLWTNLLTVENQYREFRVILSIGYNMKYSKTGHWPIPIFLVWFTNCWCKFKKYSNKWYDSPLLILQSIQNRCSFYAVIHESSWMCVYLFSKSIEFHWIDRCFVYIIGQVFGYYSTPPPFLPLWNIHE